MDKIQIAIIFFNSLIFIIATVLGITVKDKDTAIKYFSIAVSIWSVVLFVTTYIVSPKNTLGNLYTGIGLFILALVIYVGVSVSIFTFGVGVTKPNIVRAILFIGGSVLMFIPSYFYIYLANTCTIGRCFGA